MEVNARRDIRLFLILVALLSAPFYVVLFTGRPWSITTSHLFMYVPAVAALLTTRHELGFRLGRPRHYAIAYAVPIAFVVPTYLLTWAFGLGAFDSTRLSSMAASYHVPPVALGALAIIAAPLGILNTFGEELGWSGLLTHRLTAVTTFTRASLIRGVIWSVWHYPLVIVLLPRYRPQLPLLYGLACMTVAVTAISFVYTWLRIVSSSIWPAALLHAASSNFQDLFEALTKNTGRTPYITYEYGAGFAVILIFIAWYFRSIAPVTGDPHAMESAARVVAGDPDRAGAGRIDPGALDQDHAGTGRPRDDGGGARRERNADGDE
jgi:membrane protease YdiL (CAAX protease family)